MPRYPLIAVFAWLLPLSVWANEPAAVADAPKRVSALDLVSRDAVGAIAIRNVAELTKRGDDLIDKTGIKVPLRLSEGYTFVVHYLGIRRGLAADGSAVLMAFGENLDEHSLVLAAPVDDLSLMAANFSLQPEELVPGKVIDRQQREGEKALPLARYLSLRGSHLLIGGDPKRVEIAARGESIRGSLPPDDAATLDQDDVLLYVAPQKFENWEGTVRAFRLETEGLAPDEVEALREFQEAAPELRYAASGLRLEEGLGASVMLGFEGEKSRRFLSRLSAGKGAKSTLAGLPTGRVIAAHAGSGSGAPSAAIARAMLHYSLRLYDVDTQAIVSAGHRSNVVGVFGDVWQRLEGSRTALYENDAPQRDGGFSLVAILDTRDAAQFVSEVTHLARFVNAAGFSAGETAEVINAQTIAELIKQLGDDDFRVRHSAATKLGLVGPPALAALERAAQASDLEVKLQARRLAQQIQLSVAEEKQELLKRDLLSRIKPQFAYFPRAESRLGRPVDIVQMRLQFDDVQHEPQLRRLLGPQWNKLRLATVGKQVIVLCGSNTALFDQAVSNLVDGRAGLHGDERLGCFSSRAAAPLAEFHLAVARSQVLTSPEMDSQPPAQGLSRLTSFGVSLVRQRIRFDMFAPIDDVTSVVRQIPPWGK